ncbi:hypothetical protein SASPL_117865 [Salvia splendens]|uniref:ABC1 atypical kinase-like domain-containing protein n=1 Tax=Salvia splendens TaxID=180675 RepID=A0A8X8XYQ4_SALSN|nr:hypothetical protein SASPL_117865 [Salvia splendens]
MLPPISRIARAMSLALSRSNLVAPGILAFVIGEAILFSPCMVMAPFADSLGMEFRRSWLRIVRVTLEKAGPAFIKWGQWAAARPDLFPSDLCQELAELHSNAPAHSFAYTKKAVEKAFGRRLTEIFDKFDVEPLASGSVAQVHQATLGFKVIPTLRWLRLDESIKQFAAFMMSQVDLAREAANLSRFIYNFRHWKDVSFPKPLYPLVHPAVLVETYEHGESILHYVDKHEGQEHIKTALAHIGTHALLKMLLLLLECLLGMTAELSKKDRENLVEFFKAVALCDGRCAAECTLRLSSARTFKSSENDIMEIYVNSAGGFPKAHELGAIQRTTKYEILLPTKSLVFQFLS